MQHLSEDQLRAYARDQLPQAESETVEAHLDTCAVCAEQLLTVGPVTPEGLTGVDLKAAWSELQIEKSFTPPAFLSQRWNVERLLGYGGLGVVYLATRKASGETVALKVATTHPRSMDRIRRELKIMEEFGKHGNLVQYYDHEINDFTCVIEMEYVEGETLSQLVARERCLDTRRACGLALQIARGVNELWPNIVHRDIKPGNLMLDKNGLVRILDLGLAKVFHEQDEDQPDLTITRHFEGTPACSSPEQMDDPKRVDFRADLFSIGCVLHFLLTGRFPFGEGARREVQQRQQSADPLLLKTRPDVAPEVDEIVRTLLHLAPEERTFASAAQLAQALWPYADERSQELVKDWLRDEPPLVATRRAPPQRAARPAWLNPLWIMPLTAALLLIPVGWALQATVFSLKAQDGVILVEVDESQRDGEAMLGWQFEIDGNPKQPSLVLNQAGSDQKLKIDAPPGKRMLRIIRPDFEAFSQEVLVTAAGSAPIRARFVPTRQDPPPPPMDTPFGDGTAWRMRDGDNLLLEETGLIVRADDKPNFLITKRNDYRNYHVRLYLSADEGTDAFLVLGAQVDTNGKWTGITSRIFDDGSAIRSGHSFQNFTHAEHGMGYATNPYDKSFKLDLDLKESICNILVDDKRRSGVSYIPPRIMHDRVGAIGLLVKKGVVRVREIEINEWSTPPTRPAPPVEAKASGDDEASRAPKFVSGNWVVRDGALEQTTTDQPALLIFGDRRWQDGDLTCEVWHAKEDVAPTLLVRAVDRKQHVYVEFGGYGNTLLDLELVHAKGYQRLGAQRFQFPIEQWVPVKVQLRGGAIRVFVEGEEVLHGEDATRVAGGIGLRTWNGLARYRNVRFADTDGKVLWEGYPDGLANRDG